MAELHVVLNPLGAIAGTVTDEHGHPLANVAVSAVDYTTTYGGGGTTSRADGSYVVRRMMPGDYSLCFRDDRSWPNQPVTGGDSTTGYVTTCYPNAINYHGGDPVTVTGSAVTTVTGTLRSAAEVTGTVRDSAGNPIASASVAVYDGGPVPNSEVVTDADGRYELDLLTPGDHTLCASYGLPAADGLAFRFQCNGGAASTGAATPITLADGQVATKNWTLAEAGGARGLVTDATGNPIIGIYVEFDNLADGSRYDAFSDKLGQWQINNPAIGPILRLFRGLLHRLRHRVLRRCCRERHADTDHGGGRPVDGWDRRQPAQVIPPTSAG